MKTNTRTKKPFVSREEGAKLRKKNRQTTDVIVVQPEEVSYKPAVTHTPDMLIAMGIEKGMTIDVLERLSALQKEWLDRQAKSAFLQSMTDFQSEVPVIPKTKNVFFEGKEGKRDTNYNHAELDKIDAIIKPFKKKFGLSTEWKYRHFKNEQKVDMIEVTCVVSHVSGHSESTSMEGEHDNTGNKGTLQQRGSTVTYLQRYTLIGALGLTTANTDNDGREYANRARGNKQEATPKGTAEKPTMSNEQFNKAIVRINKGEDIIGECKLQFTLSEKQKAGLEAADQARIAKKEEGTN